MLKFIFRSASKRDENLFISASCSPSDAPDEPVTWQKLKSQPPTEPTPYDDRWDPSSSPTPSPVVPGVEGIYTYLDISTIHITPRDRSMLLNLGQNSWLTAIQHDFGTIVVIPEDIGERDVIQNEFSKYFLLVLNYAVNSGCRMINFDCDGKRLDDLFSKFEEDQ